MSIYNLFLALTGDQFGKNFMDSSLTERTSVFFFLEPLPTKSLGLQSSLLSGGQVENY